MAIFYRINALSRVMEDALRKKSIPYVMARGVEFYNRKVVKDVLAYLRVIANPDDEVSLTRVVNTPPRGIGDSSVKLMKEHALIRGISLWSAMKEAPTAEGLSARAVKSTAAFVNLVENWRATAPLHSSPSSGTPGEGRGGGPVFSSLVPEKGPVTRLMEDVVKRSGLEATLKKDEGEEGDDPLANVNELISSAAEYEAENPESTLNEYLSMISLVSDIDHMKGNGGAVTMMTLHAAKGLEFPVVAIIGLEEGILPHSRSRDSEEEGEEERRLLFVGITRAQERLLLTKAAYRTIRGLRERTITSPFLNELPPDAIQITDHAGGISPSTSREEYRERLMEEAEQLAGSFHQGQMVKHPAFGVGRIAEISNMGQQTRAVVEFKNVGRKTLILQYARLEPVG